MLLKFLKNPYPFIFNAYSFLVPSVVTFVLILFLKPLGFSSVEFSERLLIAFIISSIIAGSIALGVKVLQLVFPRYMNEDTWTLGREISLWLLVLLIIIFSISIVFIGVVMYQYQEQTTVSWRLFFYVFWRTAYFTLGFSIIPMLILILFEQHNHQRKQLKKATQFSDTLKRELKDVKQATTEKISFNSDKNVKELQVKSEDIIFIKSDGNYIEVHYKHVETTKRKLIRNTIKTVEGILPKTQFFRCHNRFIININFITNVKGNARGLYLELDNSEEVIPVSRSKVKGFKAVFENQKTY